MIATCFAGCDISSRWLDLCIETPCGRVAGRWGNDVAGQAEVVAAVHAAAPAPGSALVVIEASGGYEAGILAAFWAAGLAVALVPAQRVRHFARAGGQLAKTDRIDAEVLARFAQAMRPPSTPPMDENRRLLRGLVAQRRIFVTTGAAEKKRLRQSAVAEVTEGIKAHIDWLTAAIASLTPKIKLAIAALRGAAERERLMRSMPGVGPNTAAVLLADMPELGALAKGEIAALAGLAPHPRQSGGWTGKSYISGGRKHVRDALYMAATTAVFKSPTRFTQTYNALRAAGKPHKLALVAVMRKMIVTLNAMLKYNQPFAA